MADPFAVIRWARESQADFLLRDFFTFAKHSGMCKDITEAEYREVCDVLEMRLPGTRAIMAWRAAYNRPCRVDPEQAAWEQLFFMYQQPRLTFKTSLVAAVCLFAILIDPDIRIVLGRATTALSEDTLDGIKTHVERNQTIIRAFGDLRSKFETWTDEKITRGDRASGLREPTIDTTGLNTSKTGAHPDLVILDDLVHELNYESPAEMKKARILVDSYDPIMERWGSLILSGTRWGENDLYGKLLEDDERMVQQNPEARRKWDTHIVGPYHTDGRVRFPTPLPEQRIERLRQTISPKMFSAWILNQPRDEGENIFTLSHIRYFNADFVGGPFGALRLHEDDPLRRRFGPEVPLHVVMLVDPAPTVGPKSDYTGIAVIGFDQYRNWWTLWAKKVKKLPKERLDLIVFLARRFQPRTLALENADLDQALLQEKLQHLGLETQVVGFNPRLDRRRITQDPHLAPRGQTKKYAQIEKTESVLSDGRAYFAVGDTQELVSDLTKYPQIDHDDLLDAWSMGLAYETAAAVRARPDPDAFFEAMEMAEYASLGLDENGNPRDERKAQSRPGKWAGLMSGPLRQTSAGGRVGA